MVGACFCGWHTDKSQHLTTFRKEDPMTPIEILATQAIVSRAKEIRNGEASKIPEVEYAQWCKENDSLNRFIELAIAESKAAFNLIKKCL